MAAGMFEQSIISKLLEGGSLDVLHTNNVTSEMFLTCGSEIAFILKHYVKPLTGENRKLIKRSTGYALQNKQRAEKTVREIVWEVKRES